MIGVPGTADRLFAALKDADVSVSLISQASSEHSICIAVPESLAKRAHAVTRAAFAEELEGGQIQRVDVTESQSIIAVVGANMAGHQVSRPVFLEPWVERALTFAQSRRVHPNEIYPRW